MKTSTASQVDMQGYRDRYCSHRMNNLSDAMLWAGYEVYFFKSDSGKIATTPGSFFILACGI